MRNFYLILLCASLSATTMYSMDNTALKEIFKEDKTQTVTKYNGQEWLRSEPKHKNPAWKSVVLRRKGWLYDDVIELGNSLTYDYPTSPEQRRELSGLSKTMLAGGTIIASIAVAYSYLQDNEDTE